MPANSTKPSFRINSAVNSGWHTTSSKPDPIVFKLLRRLRRCESSVGSLSLTANARRKSATVDRRRSKRAGKTCQRSDKLAIPRCRATLEFPHCANAAARCAATADRGNKAFPWSPVGHKFYSTTGPRWRGEDGHGVRRMRALRGYPKGRDTRPARSAGHRHWPLATVPIDWW
jgi:hypothetical protein